MSMLNLRSHDYSLTTLLLYKPAGGTTPLSDTGSVRTPAKFSLAKTK